MLSIDDDATDKPPNKILPVEKNKKKGTGLPAVRFEISKRLTKVRHKT